MYSTAPCLLEIRDRFGVDTIDLSNADLLFATLDFLSDIPSNLRESKTLVNTSYSTITGAEAHSS